MNEPDLDRFEADLGQIRPARPPEQLMARLLAAQRPAPDRREAEQGRANWAAGWAALLRWLAPATAGVVAAFVWWRTSLPPAPVPVGPDSMAGAAALNADDVRVDRELIASFDAVARLPSGEPVRFRCQKWMDQVTLSDKSRGVVIEERTPRVEVVPVRFETY